MPKVKSIHKPSYQRKLANVAVQNELEQICHGAQAVNQHVPEPFNTEAPDRHEEAPLVDDAIVEAEEILIHENAEQDLGVNNQEPEISSSESESEASVNSAADSSDPDDGYVDMDDDLNFQSNIAVWSIQYGITSSATNALLSILRQRHLFLPKDSRTLKKTPTFTQTKRLVNGQYVHVGVEKSVILKMEQGLVPGCNSVDLKVFTDGVKFYKSVNHEGWPILFSSDSFIDSSPGVIGLFYGVGKPNRIGDFLEDYIEEVQHIKDEGIWFRGRNFPINIKFYLADAPARAYLKSTMGHTSAHGCERCDQEGDFIGFQTYQSTVGNLRTDQSFDLRLDAEHHHEDISPLAALETRFISQFPLDPMHLIDLGIFKRFLQYVFRRSPLNIRMTGNDIERFDQLLTLLSDYTPVEFKRKPTLSRLNRWKATEFGLVFKYLGLVIFSVVLKDEVYNVFLLLHSAVFIYSNDDLIRILLDSAKQFATQFVQYSAQLFGPQFIVYNEHSFLHLGDDVERYGKLSNFSAYPFESMLGRMKHLILSPSKPLQQIHRRLTEKASVEARAKRNRADDRFSIEHTNGPVGNLIVQAQYAKYECKGCTLYVSEPNNCVLFSDGKYGLVQNLVRCEDGVKRLLARTFNGTADLYNYPLPSSDLGIVILSNLEECLTTYLFSDILSKCFYMPLREGAHVAVPLNHML
ncbi:Ferredoxin oxidoreductase 1 subunit ForD [Frankliniella fusca]|uniref:Ferredoxin oxidoreductase 1 subunit ForD n=1 Tax=Frankliniella fusca TaxID=407009 RepID=A0AAE1GWE8_9NEOP|nr:Ferredoxin oxidoreductase 1 subunit ForD [Frankliniella fusca]